MRKTKEEAEVTRQNLLKAALVVFSRQGYADTRLEAIAEEAGVTRGAIYHHFGGKAELYNTLIEDVSMRAARVMQNALAQGGSPLALLKRIFVSLLVYVTEDDEYRAVQELLYFKTAFTPELQGGFEKKVEATHALIAELAALVQAGVDSGEIRAGVDVRDAAVALLALQTGLLSLWLIDRSVINLRTRAAAAADIFINGLSAG